jgi:UDP-N-acetylglucosamine 3-dehydrogenase
MSRSIRVAVVGTGSWGVEHLRAYSSLPGIEIVGVYDVDPAAARRAIDHVGLPGARVFESVEEMAGADAVDLVSVCTSEVGRIAVVQPLVTQGKAVLLEKPVAATVVEAEAIATLARQSSAVVMPGHVLRFDPRLVHVRERIADGTVGRPRSLYLRRMIPSDRLEKYSRSHPALMAAIHDIDTALWYFGAMPVDVRSHAQRSAADHGAIDVLWIFLTFADGGIAVIENTWTIPNRAGIWLESEVEVIGENGIAFVRDPGDGLMYLVQDGQVRPDWTLAPFLMGRSVGALREELAYLAQCVADGVPPDRVTMDDGVRALSVALEVAAAPVTTWSADSPRP